MNLAQGSRRRLFGVSFVIAVLALPAFAYEISAVKVGGDKAAEVVFRTSDAVATVPTWKVEGGDVEMSFPEATLSAGPLDMSSPHALIQSIHLASGGSHLVRAKLVLNGKTEGLKDRLSVGRDGRGVVLKIDYPAGDHATLDLLQEEQQPLALSSKTVHLAEPTLGGKQIVLVVVLLSLAGFCTFFFFRFLKTKGSGLGSRKYLVEQLSYCPFGPKTGVSLIKVGKELLLVGVTPQQVTLLSSLPRLQEQYDEETRFERESFREAVGEEIHRMESDMTV